MIEFISGITVGTFVAYTLVKIRYLEAQLAKFVTKDELGREVVDMMPSPQEIAKEVIKVKVPMEDLPQDLKDKLETLKRTMNNPLPPFPDLPQVQSLPLKEATYIG